MELLERQWNTIQVMLDWRVTLDILLIGLAIFSLYHFLKATGTWKIVAGVMIAGVVFIVARLLDLRGIVWIYTYLSPVILISMVIIFQPEIRRLLERAASLTGKRLEEDAQSAQVICDAVFGLAARGEGAIVVLPGKEATQPWMSEGVRMDAAISHPLLMSLFDPHSPGHDGAVIVENGKAVSFGVRLPLSKSGRLSEEFGTRHHAGQGLSEATDALAIIVSEERKEVRVFLNGKGEPMATKDALLRSITAHWRRTASRTRLFQPGRKKRTLFKELGISFLLALLFWSSVVLTQIEIREASYRVPVRYVTEPGLRVQDASRMNPVLVHVAGSASVLEGLKASHLDVQVDLRGAQPGEHDILLTSEDIRLPRSVRLLRVEPDRWPILLLFDANSTPR